RNRSTSSLRFSSLLAMTRSGSRRTIFLVLGFLVPRTLAHSRSVGWVHQSVTPASASARTLAKLSVMEGTSDTTRRAGAWAVKPVPRSSWNMWSHYVVVVGVTGIEESGDGEESATEDSAIPLGRGDNDIDAMLDEPVQRAGPRLSPYRRTTTETVTWGGREPISPGPGNGQKDRGGRGVEPRMSDTTLSAEAFLFDMDGTL